MTEIYQEMKKRQRGRGDVAMVRQAEQTGMRVAATDLRMQHMEDKMDMIIKHFGLKVPIPTQPQAQARVIVLTR